MASDEALTNRTSTFILLGRVSCTMLRIASDRLILIRVNEYVFPVNLSALIHCFWCGQRTGNFELNELAHARTMVFDFVLSGS